MAITHLSPSEEAADDLLTIDQILALIQESGYPVSKTTLNRWISRHGLRRERAGRVVYVSFTDVLEVQRAEARRAGLIV